MAPGTDTDTDTETETRELDHRSTGDGIDVWLLWHRALQRVSVRVRDAKTGDDFEVRVAAGESPLDVFHHPFAYAAARR